jgi:uncharacterized protein involved in exopolysaccharide biosynthesis
MKQHALPNPVGPAPRSFGPADDPVSVSPYVQALWRRRVLVLVLALVGGAAAFTLASLTARQYEAVCTLVLTESKVGDTAGPAPAVNNFVSILENYNVASDIIREFGLDQGPYWLGPSTFLLHVLKVERINQTGVVQVRVRLPDAQLSEKVANRIAQRGLDLVQRMGQTELEHGRDQIRSQMEESRKRMDDLEVRLETLRKQSQVDLLKSDVDTLLTQRQNLADVSVQIASEEAWLTKAEEELAKRTRVDVLNKSFDGSDPVLSEAQKAGLKDVLGLRLKNEQINPTYDELDAQVARTRATLKGLQQQRAALLSATKLNASQLPRLSELYAREAAIARLEVERDLARRVYVDVATKYEQARLQVASRSAMVQVVDPAIVPDQALSRNRGRNAVFGILGGLFLGFGIVVVGQIARHAAVQQGR